MMNRSPNRPEQNRRRSGSAARVRPSSQPSERQRPVYPDPNGYAPPQNGFDPNGYPQNGTAQNGYPSNGYAQNRSPRTEQAPSRPPAGTGRRMNPNPSDPFGPAQIPPRTDAGNGAGNRRADGRYANAPSPQPDPRRSGYAGFAGQPGQYAPSGQQGQYAQPNQQGSFAQSGQTVRSGQPGRQTGKVGIYPVLFRPQIPKRSVFFQHPPFDFHNFN